MTLNDLNFIFLHLIYSHLCVIKLIQYLSNIIYL